MAKNVVLRTSVVLSATLSIITLFVVVSYALTLQAELTAVNSELTAVNSELDVVNSELDALDAQIEVLTKGSEHHEEGMGMLTLEPTVEFTLKTWSKSKDGGGFAFIGVGGSIDGQRNPMLMVEHDDVVKITVINDDGVEHDLKVEGLDVHSQHVEEKGESASIVFKIEGEGEIKYYCSIPGHRELGMEGTIMVE